ncbi:MAG TPA: citramalate synthase [Solirubrobacteraceae bacterium]|jgi:2-isopropylmalate synthase|nr:citramalate synthase [Solirubrobacteraceae bacterium]
MDGNVRIYDTTLRDGCQAAGISLSLADKLRVARLLDDFGVDYVEGGWPGSNPKDAQFFAALREEPLRHARASAFGSTRRAGTRAADDENLRVLLAAQTPTVAIVAKGSSVQVRRVLRTTPEENLAMVGDSVRHLKQAGREVVLDAEHFFDGVHADRDHALAVLQAAVDAGADWLVLCDTNGGSLPELVAATVAEVVAAFGPIVGIHAHDDGGLAVANSLAAVSAGAGHVQGTINGYGERVGNANLCTLVANLVLRLGRSCAAGEHLDRLTALSHAVDEIANVTPNPRLPFVGRVAFAHKGGVHVHAVARDPSTYEHLDPALVGNERRIMVSELSGRATIAERASEFGVTLDPGGDAEREALRKLKQLESQGFQFEDAAASFELLVRRCDVGYEPPFEALAYAVDSRMAAQEAGTSSIASAEAAVGGEVLRGEAMGGGPVDALEKAVRRALTPAYPHLTRVGLTDFRSHIARGGDGERGSVTVRITGSVPSREPWTTVSSSGDLLHASWLALVDNLEYAVLTKAGVTGALPAELRPSTERVSVRELAAELAPALTAADVAVLDTIEATDWSQTALDIADAQQRTLAACATALGAALFYSFGNFCAVAAHPRWESVRRVNLLKGRPENQVGSVTTTRDRYETLFDWHALPAGLTQAQVLALMDDFYALGPMGFRGPAAAIVPGHLTSLDAQTRTTQVIAPGHRCPSNALLEEILGLVADDFLFITSANVSSGVTGRVEPAHYDLEGIRTDFGHQDGVVLIGHRAEAKVRASYPRHLPMSTSIVAFHKLGVDEAGEPAIVLERHGSLDLDDMREVVARHGFGLMLEQGARERLPMRDDAAAA